MMKSEKLWDFKTQEEKIQAVWNAGIRNIEITRAASQPSAKEKKTFDASGVFDSCEIASKLQHSIGKGLRESSVSKHSLLLPFLCFPVPTNFL